jgi:hypothetical protein
MFDIVTAEIKETNLKRMTKDVSYGNLLAILVLQKCMGNINKTIQAKDKIEVNGVKHRYSLPNKKVFTKTETIFARQPNPSYGCSSSSKQQL